MEDTRCDHFYLLIGSLCEQARIGDHVVEVTTATGGPMSGVPEPTPAGEADEEEVDDTGWAQPLRIGGVVIALEDVRAVTVRHPTLKQ